ncbi:magnesium-protoporphyrin IX monomethyl ester (oxidative) cyclase [Cylindrospermopsis raciborskii S07]|jgi:magnesium-protoporphyrin IX monomethyl ester (oxidative) cyclase|uniref:Magnesium-protoporphyrin IX monomethyl ester [oxidative] cyclase n=2 Tax=Cylindrospermopsis raciborskii TaxID=77022 RepID=A0A853MEC5_9CYAN|nr:magnesium-protoporphyrin IX monomethyl ester (oxidative) cyclase [Cylindrospermopsis raciborskii]EFA70555.1 Magnesium-protoporphyrin IX monomethyl ester aerobic oxidative cyclase [Cylindrospermopsis raciborskii CS-505]MCH4905598.1 magnesium-protoporphyrin IX monomethyl ester (oxidative) cyclase [Cylindrospermopsis raciborskii CHAB3438]MEB3147165.1 magnesium-protoporphyrin IX monomethyl ester (oxidative) cyclase [Cylindrospermopsis raciborskii]OBU77289.1 magnesium-protoporphyrin IX monomethyl
MVNSLKKPTFEEIRPGVKVPAKETLLTPRFYTTDFDEMARMDISVNEDELRAILEEFRVDYNRHHFVRDAEFEQSWDHIDGQTRQLFIEFLERSCTAEFSGFLLYKELGRRLKDKSPLLAECFNLMSRDEARHAGFLNKAMSDFNLSLDLGFLTKSRSYTFFKPKFIFYATYLSEKIGYWRYITIYRHLEKHPEDRIYPIFRFFENWCQDENRHGDFFDAIMKAQPQMLRGWQGKLWSRFFLLSVFATMYLNDIQRKDFYAAIGLDAREYDIHVIKKTNETAGRVFPIILDVESPEFYQRLDICIKNNERLTAISNGNSPKFLQFLQKIPIYISHGWQFLKLYLMKPIDVLATQGQPK